MIMRALNAFRCHGKMTPLFIASSFSAQSNYTPKSKWLPPDGATFTHLAIGQEQTQTMLPYSFWNFQFQQKDSSYIQLEFDVVRGSSLGLYARKNAIPTMTVNDVKDVIAGTDSRRQARSLLLVS